MSAEVNIYDFEGAIEGATAQMFTDEGIVCLTEISDPQFQKERPRLEIEFTLGSSGTMLLPERGVVAAAGFARATTFSGNLSVDVITAADYGLHRQFKARVRNIIATLARRLNDGIKLPYHAISSVNFGSAEPMIKAEDGLYLTRMSFDLNFSVQANAWASLNAEQ